MRTAFTHLCFRSKGSTISKNRGPSLLKVLNTCQKAFKRNALAEIRHYSSKKGSLKNGISKLAAFVQHKKMKIFSEAFYYTASYGLIRREHKMNLTLMVLQLGKLRNMRLKEAFSVLRENKEKGLGLSMIKKNTLNTERAINKTNFPHL